MGIAVEYGPSGAAAGRVAFKAGKQFGQYERGKEMRGLAMQAYGIQAPLQAQKEMQAAQLEWERDKLAQQLGFSQQELDWARDQFGQQLAFDREQLAQQLAIARQQMAVQREEIASRERTAITTQGMQSSTARALAKYNAGKWMTDYSKQISRSTYSPFGGGANYGQNAWAQKYITP